MALLNLQEKNPFDDVEEDDFAAKNAAYVHIRIQQRTGRKSLTIVEGLSAQLDLKAILKALKKQHCCNGSILESEESGDVIQLQGDQRQNVATFLTAEGICKKDNVKVHGF
mmetsp:Transcript_61701/g.145883  ORF Transcript_61701/g.145883 Transcript_61701/m.145883 type:complete len:111 (+) Transcript_61701:76-408(+)|eukprot:CAMPEP_0117040692 /NCGR_PEP_ID=MMETSP0472-20121206/28451_1 /TAXON_ID=693140 ORGANISM="Tiarina fusus, Strain LIS" /NCGR_SAMPLE_ID=MMETSP0472 /ASSEMBLY_ACC=CAM_ASM_000603 /LENGTH=110 /DNA_ID=CAMNT_0004751473 /DNA_START=46 /DNA_END=378 /DNA_ORIENTATION=+